MRTLLGVPVVALLLAVCSADVAEARYCGAARYSCCAADCCDYAAAKQQCHTVMKTCREVVYEKQNYTCYKDGLRANMRSKDYQLCKACCRDALSRL